MSNDQAAIKGNQEEKQPVTEFKRPGYSLFVEFSADKMECRCSYLPREHGTAMTLSDLNGFLAQANVKTGIDEAAREQLLIGAAAGKEMEPLLIARGIPVQDGADGYFQATALASLTAHTGNDDDGGDVLDFRSVQTYINVRPDDEVGRIIPCRKGIPGRKVTGEIAIAKHGKPLKYKLGKNIRFEEEDSRLIAESGGRVVMAFGEISVEQEYRVSGNVDLKVGHIDFNGVVDICGDVFDGFNVRASKGLRVGGNIGACDVVVDGDIIFRGMDGQENGSIVCSGSIYAQFIHDCLIECAGDVIVEREIHNCTINALGRVVVAKGAIIGGSCTTLNGVEASRFGSRSSVHTKLVVGADYREIKLLERLHSDLAANHEKLGNAKENKEIELLRLERSALTDSIMEIRSKTNTQANPKINVRAVLCENVLVTIGLWSQKFNDEQKGPVSIIENTLDGGLRFLSMTDLAVRAAYIEQMFIQASKT